LLVKEIDTSIINILEAAKRKKEKKNICSIAKKRKKSRNSKDFF
jgi:hypothetical protein